MLAELLDMVLMNTWSITNTFELEFLEEYFHNEVVETLSSEFDLVVNLLDACAILPNLASKPLSESCKELFLVPQISSLRPCVSHL